MVFRDEHEAALSRADALERERDLAEAERRRVEAELCRARLERDALAAELGDARRRLSDAGLDETRPVREPTRTGGVVVAVVGLLTLTAVAPTLCQTSRPSAPPPPIEIPRWQAPLPPLPSPPSLPGRQCLIDTIPAGAEVALGRAVIGRTPLLVSRGEWAGAGELDIRLEGYETAVLPAPADPDSCDVALGLATRSR